jgi:3-deoxy-D-manno-octulosonate 8-phosphate phosphatase (KDO 8-P phosphatase)
MDQFADRRQPTAAQAAAQIKLMGFDVDGTLTDGGLYFGNEGEVMKRFSVFDGQGLRLLMDHGIKVIWITARSSTIVEKRAKDLGIYQLVQGCKTKLQALNGANAVFLATTGLIIRCYNRWPWRLPHSIPRPS